jgi:hypothetical protein
MAKPVPYSVLHSRWDSKMISIKDEVSKTCAPADVSRTPRERANAPALKLVNRIIYRYVDCTFTCLRFRHQEQRLVTGLSFNLSLPLSLAHLSGRTMTQVTIGSEECPSWAPALYVRPWWCRCCCMYLLL